MRRYPLRRNQLKLYRILFATGAVLVVLLLLKGISILASGSLSGAIHKFGVYAFRSMYVRASNQNNLFSYVTGEKTGDTSVFTAMADGISINYYAVHEGRLTVLDTEENEDENIEVDEEMLYALIQQYREINFTDTQNNMDSDVLEIQYESGNVERLPENYTRKPNTEVTKDDTISVFHYLQNQYSMEQLNDFDYLISNFYILDESTSATRELFDAQALLSMDLSIDPIKDGPHILIYHTHASETYIDSKPGVQADTVVGPGNYLKELLEEYGYQVYHDTTAYDRLPNGDDNRNYAYSTARPCIEQILAENPSIQVVLDLHRDSGAKRVTVINGKDTAQIMLFNGLCRNQQGQIERLPNENLKANLAMSLQTALVGRKLYDGYIVKNYLKNYRYNMHLMERYLLIELGTEKNTVMEAYNAMEPLAVLLNQVLTNCVE